jgi:hypothetical protein
VLWFIKLRESVDVEAELYTYMEVAATKELLQIGFDDQDQWPINSSVVID